MGIEHTSNTDWISGEVVDLPRNTWARVELTKSDYNDKVVVSLPKSGPKGAHQTRSVECWEENCCSVFFFEVCQPGGQKVTEISLIPSRLILGP